MSIPQRKFYRFFPILLMGLLIGGWGCTQPQKGPFQDLGVSISELQLATTKAAEWQTQAFENVPTTDGPQVMHLYWEVDQGITIPRQSEAWVDSFWCRLEDNPHSLVWAEFCIRMNRFIPDAERKKAALERAAGPDSTGPVALFLQGRKRLKEGQDAGQEFFIALGRAEELAPVSQAWLHRSIAMAHKNRGDKQAALNYLYDTLPQAWQAGGLALATIWWKDISKYHLLNEDLDEALVAAEMTRRCAQMEKKEIPQLLGDIYRGRTHLLRGEFDEAEAKLILVEKRALAGSHSSVLKQAMQRRSRVYSAWGDRSSEIKLNQDKFRFMLALGDTAEGISSSVYIAMSFNYLGQRDSSDIWMERAEELNEMWSGYDFDPQFLYSKSSIHLQRGNYATADSLRDALVATGIHYFDKVMAFDIVEQALDTGRSDLAYEGIQNIRSSLGFIERGSGYNPHLDLNHLSARLYARQGEFGLAAQELDMATQRIAKGATLFARWDNTDCRGRVAEYSGDLKSAGEAYRQGLEVAGQLKFPSLAHRSRIRLAEVLLKQRQFEEARQLFEEASYASGYWTRFSAALLMGCADLAEDHPSAAMKNFQTAETLLRPDAPLNLRARLHLEKGRALAAMGEPQEAWRQLSQVDLSGKPGESGGATEIHRAFHLPLHQELAETKINLLFDHPELAGPFGLALESLAIAEQSRWQVDATEFQPTVESLAQFPVQAGSPVVVWFVGNERVFRWIGSQNGWLMAEVYDRDRLMALVNAMQTDFESPTRPINRPELRELSQRLLGDIKPLWEKGQTLSLVAPNSLNDLAWPALLVDDRQSLIDHGAVVHWVGLASPGTVDPGSQPRAMLAVGVNTSEGAQSLRYAEEEARTVADVWAHPSNRVVVGDQATWSKLLSLDLAEFGVIHLASHAVVTRGAPGWSTLRLASDEGFRPVTTSEASDLGLNAELVFLSCCEGARLGQETGTGVASFTRAFLQAGANSVIASTHKVEDEAAMHLALTFYRLLKNGESRENALRMAQKEVRQSDSKWSHPFYWAFYQIHEVGRFTR